MDLAEDLRQLGVIVLAAALGAAVGIEREIADKPAGLRTHMFVCAAAALLMLLGDIVLDHFQGIEQAINLQADPIRVIQAIVIGISFLGAGTIIHRDGKGVEGLTTASSILLTAGIGIATAVGRWGLAVGVALFALIVLFVMGQVERAVQRWNVRRGAAEPDERL